MICMIRHNFQRDVAANDLAAIIKRREKMFSLWKVLSGGFIGCNAWDFSAVLCTCFERDLYGNLVTRTFEIWFFGKLFKLWKLWPFWMHRICFGGYSKVRSQHFSKLKLSKSLKNFELSSNQNTIICNLLDITNARTPVLLPLAAVSPCRNYRVQPEEFRILGEILQKNIQLAFCTRRNPTLRTHSAFRFA